MLLAVMDLGSNSFKMTVAQWAPELSRSRPFRVLHKERHAIQLGSSVFVSGKISPKDAKEAFKAIEKMQARLRDFSSPVLRVVATSAIREATNGGVFVRQVRDRLGIPIEIISGSEEARLIAYGLEWEYPKIRRGLLIDIGGGSTEVATFGRGWSHLMSQSFRMGSVRLFAQYFRKKGKIDLVKIRKSLKTLWKGQPSQRIEKLVGSAGAIQSLGKILQPSRSTPIVRKRALDLWIERNYKKSPAWLAKKYDIAPSRARVVVPGALILSEVLAWLKQSEISVTEMTLRDGLLVDLVKAWTSHKASMLLAAESPKLGVRRGREQQLLKFLESTAARFHVDLAHARHMALLSLSLFDQMVLAGAPFGAEERQYLLVTAYLHDIGKIISKAAHHKHSAYVLRNLQIPGLSPLEWKKCALIALFHRKESAPKRNPLPGGISGIHAEQVRRLSAILRLVDGLDEDHTQNVESVTLKISKKQALIELQLRHSESMNMEYFREKSSYFEEYFGLKVVSFVRPRVVAKARPVH